MIHSNNILVKKMNVNNFINSINCKPILNILKNIKDDYNIYKKNKKFLNVLKGKIIHYYLVSDNYHIKLIVNGNVLQNFIDDEGYFVLLNNHITIFENKICLQYLKDKIDDQLFLEKMTSSLLTELQKKITKIKKDCLEHNEIVALMQVPNMINYFTNIDLINILNKNNKIFKEYNNIKSTSIDFIDLIIERLSYEIILLNENILTRESKCIVPKKLILDNLRKFILTEEKVKLFNKNKHFFLGNKFLLDFQDIMMNRTLKDEQVSLYYDLLSFVFYGLYFKLFTKEELLFLEKNGILFEVLNHSNINDFDLLLKKNDFELKEISNIIIHSYESLDFLINNYPNNNLNIEYDLNSNHISDTYFIKELILLSECLVKYNTITIYTFLISEKEIINTLKKYVDIFAMKNNISEIDFLILVKDKLFIE